MNNAERFLDIYNKVDRYLKNIDTLNYETFASKIKNSKNPLIKRFKEKLLDFAELRNAIVHNPKIGSEHIAEPHTKIVEEFEEIYKVLTKPMKVIPLYQFEVIGAKAEDKIDKILKIMRAQSFSQFPVFDNNNNVIELINTNTISRWLSNQIENNEIITENPKISEFIPEIEFKMNYKFISRDCDIYTAYNYFIEQIEKCNRNLDVLFITNSGNKNEKLLGLITIEDIADKITTYKIGLAQ
jgi:predicted transcriptional regulator